MTLDLAIVLPTLNERGNLAPLVERIDDALSGVVGEEGWEALIIDDDSSDGTADEARELARNDPRVRVIQRIGRRGLASAAIGSSVTQISSPNARHSVPGARLSTVAASSAPSATTGTSMISDHHSNSSRGAWLPSPRAVGPQGPKLT